MAYLSGHLRKAFRKQFIRYLDLPPYRRYMLRHHCVFIHVPKAAGSSVLKVLTKAGESYQRDHATAQDFLRTHRKIFNNVFKFAFVRHPVDRLQSCYRYLSAGGNGSTDLAFSTWLNQHYPSFEAFVLEFLDTQRIHCHLQLRPQFAYLCNERYELLVDYVGHFESFDADLATVCRTIGVTFAAVHENGSKGRALGPCSQQVREKIYQLYRKDFELFGYTLDASNGPWPA